MIIPSKTIKLFPNKSWITNDLKHTLKQKAKAFACKEYYRNETTTGQTEGKDQGLQENVERWERFTRGHLLFRGNWRQPVVGLSRWLICRSSIAPLHPNFRVWPPRVHWPVEYFLARFEANDSVQLDAVTKEAWQLPLAYSSLKISEEEARELFEHLHPSKAARSDEFSAVLRPQRPYGLSGTGSPGLLTRLSHSSWALRPD